jgi:hypothetical protein
VGTGITGNLPNAERSITRGLYQQFQLRRPLYDDGIVRNRSDLLRIDMVAHGKHKLEIFTLCQGSYNGAEDIDPAIQDRPHLSIY